MDDTVIDKSCDDIAVVERAVTEGQEHPGAGHQRRDRFSMVMTTPVNM